MTLQCENLTEADIPEACALFAKVFGHSTEPAHWAWKYLQGPRLGGLNLVVRNTPGQIVGHVGASVFEGELQGRKLPMAQVTDVMVDPSARGTFDSQGVYAQFMRQMLQALSQKFSGVFTYGFVGIRPYRLGARMGHYRSQQECREGLMSPTQKTGWRDRIYTAEPIEWKDALAQNLFERIWQKSSPDLKRPTVVRNSAYMQWRYAHHPQNLYRLWLIKSLGRTTGWVVTRCMPSGQHTLIDLLPTQNGSVAQTQTLAAMAAVCRALQSDCPQTPAMLSAWSIDTPQSRLLEPIIAVEIRADQWHTLSHKPVFVPGDTDVF